LGECAPSCYRSVECPGTDWYCSANNKCRALPNPAADDRLHAIIAEKLTNDPHVDAVVIGLDPMSPAMQTLPPGIRGDESFRSETGIVHFMTQLLKKTPKPIVGVVDGGKLYDPFVEALEKGGLPVFRSSDRAVAALAKYLDGRLYTQKILL